MSSDDRQQMQPEEINVQELMDGIKAEVISSLSDAESRFPLKTAGRPSPGSNTSTPLYMSDELNYLNANWRGWPIKPELSTHRGFLGRLALRAKRYLLNLVWNGFFAEYFKREEAFQQHLVQFLNKQARYSDARDAEIFWQLIDKLDGDISALNRKCDALHDEVFASLEHAKRASTDDSSAAG